MTPVVKKDFWCNVLSDLGFEKTTILDKLAFKIPIYEVIYMAQVLGTRKTSDSHKAPSVIVIPSEKDKEITLPQQCPRSSIKYEKMNNIINPMLSPSLEDKLTREFPDFFENKEKYLLLEYVEPERIEESGLNKSDFIDFRVGYSNRHGIDYMDESIIEYITSSYFRKQGYIVDKFSESLTMKKESPDLFAIKLPELQNKLSESGVTEGGFYLNELELHKKLGSKQRKMKIKEEKSAVIEAESPTSSGRFSTGVTQVKGYLGEECFNEGYVSIPYESDRVGKEGKSPAELGYKPYDEIGIFTTDKDGKIFFRECLKEYGIEEKVDILLKNVERIVKLTLLKNLPLNQAVNLQGLQKVKSFYDLYFAVDGMSLEYILNEIDYQ